MKIKTIIFDLDGTLIDSKRDIIESVIKTLKQFNLPILSEDIITSYIGEGIELLVKRSIGEENINRFTEILEYFKVTYREECENSTVLFPGVKRVLALLREKSVKITLATNKSIMLTNHILNNLGIHDSFDIIMGPENVSKKKPDPEVVYKILEELGGILKETLIVGDSKFDIICGKNAGIHTCGVTYGIGSVQSLIDCQADFLISDIEKLLLFL